MDTKKVKPLPGSFRGFRLPAAPGVRKLAALLLAAASVSAAFTLEGHPGTPLTPSAQPLGRMGLAIGVAASGHADAALVRDKTFLLLGPDSQDGPDSAIIQDLQSGTLRINAVLGVAQWLDFGLSVPFHFDLISDLDAKRLSGSGIGDPVLSAKAGFAAAGDHVFDLGLLATISLPSKTKEGFLPKHTGYLIGNDSVPAPPRFFSAYAPGWSARALATVDLTRLEAKVPFRASLGTGLKAPGTGDGQRFLLGGGVEWIPVPFLGFYGEAQTETRADRIGEALAEDLLVASFGFHTASDDGMFFTAGIQKRASKTRFQLYDKVVDDQVATFRTGTQPDFTLSLALGWSGAMVEQDLDRDGVPDKQDPCPNEDEDKDGFQDFDGCPERDNDEDGIIDAADKCPIEPEDKDGTEDADGCPDPDNDGDNIPDALDKCPIEPEDMDGFEDYDGCPDLDNDQDAVLDQQDKCLAQPEDKDGFEDLDGCPDPDNDGDKIPDGADKCPLEAESYNNFEDGDGCPDLGRQGGALLEPRSVLRGVRFRANSTELLAGSYPALDTLAEKLKASPGTLVEIRAYMDKSGSELEQYRVTEAWATTVRKYLITLGVPANQVLSRGMGARDPVAPNTTAANRAKNRRVEAHRLN